MHILRIEHPVPDYDSWKAAFDSDPVGRERSAVRRYRTTFFMLAYALSWWASILKPVLGHRKLKNLAPDHVQYFYQSKLNAGLAVGTVRLMHGILHKALEQAVKWGLVPRNICKATTPPKPNSEEIHPLDAEQAKRFLEAARGNRLETLYVLAITAGLRIGELLGLKWEDIDLDAETLHVRRTRSQAKSGPTFTTPKNGKGRSIRLRPPSQAGARAAGPLVRSHGVGPLQPRPARNGRPDSRRYGGRAVLKESLEAALVYSLV
jgi:integrase